MGLIAIYSDFGNKDIYSGILKAAILSKNPGKQVIQLTDGIDKHDIVQGAMFIRSAIQFFPADHSSRRSGTAAIMVADTIGDNNKTGREQSLSCRIKRSTKGSGARR